MSKKGEGISLVFNIDKNKTLLYNKTKLKENHKLEEFFIPILFREIKYLETLKLDAIYVIGNNTKYYGELEQLKSFETIEELKKTLDTTIQEGDLIYIKASNVQNFNKIVNHLIEKYEVK